MPNGRRSNGSVYFSWIVAGLFSLYACNTSIAAERAYVISYGETNAFHERVRARVEAAYRLAGLPVRFVAAPHRRSIAMANAGEVDGEVGRIDSAAGQYPNLRRVAGPLAEIRGAAFTRHPAIAAYDDALLRRWRFGFVRGVLWAEEKGAGQNGFKANDYPMLFRMLATARIDLALATVDSADVVLAEMGADSRAIRKLQPFVFAAPIHHYVHRKNEAIIPLLEAAIRKLTEAGAFND